MQKLMNFLKGYFINSNTQEMLLDKYMIKLTYI